MSPLGSIRISHLAILVLFFVSGCLPTACQRRESRALFPADSVSRQLAELTPIDTLSLVWETSGSLDHPLQYPRTVRFGDEGEVFASDVQSNKIFEFLPSGLLNSTHESAQFSFPYLIGLQGDTLMVLNPDAQRIDYIYEGRSVTQIPTPEDVPDKQRLQYAVVDDDRIYYKVIGEDFQGYIARLAPSGQVIEKILLQGPFWRHAGMLRTWGDSLLSLCAFRPVIDVINAEGRMDSLHLAGFDSPMLSRSRAFMLGQIHEPPLLSPSAAIAGDKLYALNMRPGWLRIDQFDKSGRLERRLVQNTPSFSKQFYPIDMDVRVAPDSTIEIALAFVEPSPQLSLYKFDPYGR